MAEQGGKPAISVLMGVFNGAVRLRETVVSVLGQTWKDFEFIVMDDGSRDATARIMAHFADPRLRFVRSARNRGLTVSLIELSRMARGRFLARIDCGDICLPQRLERQLAFLESHGNIALAGSDYEIIDDKGRTVLSYAAPRDPASIRQALDRYNCFGHSTIMVRKGCFEAAGGYRKEFRFSQDYDLYLRLAEHHELANIGQPLVKWRIEKRNCGMRHSVEQAFYASLARDCARARRDGVKEPLGSIPRTGFRERPGEAFARYYHHLARSRPRFRDALPFLLRSMAHAPFLGDNYRFIFSAVRARMRAGRGR